MNRNLFLRLLQRKALTPNDSDQLLTELAERLYGFERYYEIS